MATWASRGMFVRLSPLEISDGSVPMKQHQLLSNWEVQYHCLEMQQEHLIVESN